MHQRWRVQVGSISWLRRAGLFGIGLMRLSVPSTLVAATTKTQDEARGLKRVVLHCKIPRLWRKYSPPIFQREGPGRSPAPTAARTCASSPNRCRVSAAALAQKRLDDMQQDMQHGAARPLLAGSPVGVAGEKNHRQRVALAPQGGLQVHTRPPRQPHVQEHTNRRSSSGTAIFSASAQHPSREIRR